MPAINRCSAASIPPAERLVSNGIHGIQWAGVLRNTPNRKRLKAQPFTSTPTEPLIDRGFTFHEHLYPFTLINMNGRAYDPLVGRFLSADPYIQAPDNTQNLNRYSYCLNNPLMYSDPSGEFLIEALIIGGLANWIMGGCKMPFGDSVFGGVKSMEIISPNMVSFSNNLNSVLGHEIIHAYHVYTDFLATFGSDASEYYASRYSASVPHVSQLEVAAFALGLSPGMPLSHYSVYPSWVPSF